MTSHMDLQRCGVTHNDITSTNDDLNDLTNDRGDIFRCCVGRVKMGYAKTMSIQQREGEQKASRHTDGQQSLLKKNIGANDEGPCVSMAGFWSGDGDSQSHKRNEGKESNLDGREHG